jgi:hypothetical protein
MDVYLVPTSQTRHELYCEISAPVSTDEAPTSSLWGRATDVFRRALAEGERAETQPSDREPHGWLRRTVTRRLAGAVAEQRLLWHLRRQTAVRLVHPDSLTPDRALETSRALLVGDRDKHRRWCVIDGLITLASAPVALVPGPNLLAYYFLFRSVGHFLSMRGAEQGLRRVVWDGVASPHLTGVRDALRLDPAARARRIDEIASALELHRLRAFVEHVAAR